MSGRLPFARRVLAFTLLRTSMLLTTGGLLTLLAFSCSTPEKKTTPPPVDKRPPRICKTPTTPTTPWFTDITDQVGLGQTSALAPVATSVVSADFDGDGYPDLLAFQGDSHRGLVNGARVRFLFMNRPDPNDPSGKSRVFVDVPDQGGLLATRDGENDRGASIAFVGDFNNDGFVDVMTCPSDFTSNATPQDPCVVFLNDGTAHFTIAPRARSIRRKHSRSSPARSSTPTTTGTSSFFPGSIAHWGYGPPGSQWHLGPRIFQGQGDGTFVDATQPFGLGAPDAAVSSPNRYHTSFGVTTCDLDGDGNMDVITGSYGREPNEVWMNQGGTFVNKAADLGLDHDDRMDYSDDQSYRCYCQATMTCNPMPPAPVLNCTQFGNPYLRGWIPGYSDQPYALGGNNFGVACYDVDNDGDMDVLFATVVHGDVGSDSDPTELILNPGDGSKFVRPGDDVTGLARPPLGLYGQRTATTSRSSSTSISMAGRTST